LLVSSLLLLVGCGAQKASTKKKESATGNNNSPVSTTQSVVGGYYPSDSSSKDMMIIQPYNDSSSELYVQSMISGQSWEGQAELSGDELVIKTNDYRDDSGSHTGTPPSIKVSGSSLIISNGQVTLYKRGTDYTKTSSSVTPENVVKAVLDAETNGRSQDALQYAADETYPKPFGEPGSNTKAQWAEELAQFQDVNSYTITKHGERGLTPFSQGSDEYKYYDVDFTVNAKGGGTQDLWFTLVSKNSGPWLIIESH